MHYKILPRSHMIASKYNLVLVPSKNPKYKIDAYFNGLFVNSFGSANAMDFPTYLKYYGKDYATKRKELYYIRHPKDYPEFSRDWLSKKILWS